MAEAAGRIVRAELGFWFVSDEVFEQLVPHAVVSPIPGSPLLMTLVDGEVLPVFPLGRLEAPLVVCVVTGGRIALGGLQVAASGSFERLDTGAHVRFEDRSVPFLDLTSSLGLLACCPPGTEPHTEGAR